MKTGDGQRMKRKVVLLPMILVMMAMIGGCGQKKEDTQETVQGEYCAGRDNRRIIAGAECGRRGTGSGRNAGK